MKSAGILRFVVAITLLVTTSAAFAVPNIPSSFSVDIVGSGFDTPTAMAFLPGGRMLVAEKRGRVYTLKNGVKSSQPLWSRENEVLNESDRGLLGLAVDPNYASNRRIYLLYTVDPDSNGTDNNNDAFGRLVRYEVSASDSTTVDYSTRAVLLGVSWRYGPLSASPSHTIGSLRFGADGSLLVSAGDGASFSQTDPGGLDPAAFGSGPNLTDPYEDIGAFRAQSLTSLSGKILRIDPENGHGYPSNPYWNGDPLSIRSRVWAYGARNPFRFCIRPGTGSTLPADGDPGTAYIGDVGLSHFEEMNVARTPGANFGWPCFEGRTVRNAYNNASPDHNDCTSFGQPDNPTARTHPDVAWSQEDPNASIPAGFIGNCSIGGVFYTHTTYPGPYQGAYFFADYGENWIRVATFNTSDQLVSVQPFGEQMDSPVDFATDPVSGDVYYVAIEAGQIRRIHYSGGVPNLPPVAVAAASPTSGVAALVVNFSSTGSNDPDSDPIGYFWAFGDGTISTLANPVHTYTYPGTFSAVLTVTDDRGGLARDTVVISSVGVSGFPTTPVVDDFNRPDGDIGGAWTGETTRMQISNQALGLSSGSSSVVWDGGVFGVNQEAYVTFSTINSSASEHDLMLKVQGTTWDAGHIEVWYNAPLGRVTVATYAPQGGWIDHEHFSPVSFAPGDWLGARALADGTVQVYRNGLHIGTVSVASWPYATLGGRIGLSLIGPLGSRLDNFGGGDVTFVTNTAPTATILEPLEGAFFGAGDTLRLRGDAVDDEDAESALEYHWRMDLTHDTHVHPSSFVSDLRDDILIGENHDDGAGVFYTFFLEVTDTGGLKDTASVSVFPEVNLHPAALQVAPGTPSAGMPMEVRFVVQNSGRMPAPIAEWVVHDGSSVLAAGDTLVPALSEVLVTVTVIAPAAGTHTLRAVVDSSGAITEVDEDDNAAALDVQTSQTPLGVGSLPLEMAVGPPRPNPSTGAARFTLDLPASAAVEFKVFDLQGRTVWNTPARTYEPGRWDLSWPGLASSGARVRPGVYLAVIDAGGRTFVRRIARLR